MRRSGSLGSAAGMTNVRRGRSNPVASGPLVRVVANTTGTNLDWANGASAPLLYDNAPGENSTSYNQAGSVIGDSSWVMGLYDLGSAQVVTRARFRYGCTGGNLLITQATILQASNDGSTWVNAYTGGVPTPDTNPAAFTWFAERDINQITATPYRYWRVGVKDTGGESPSEARLSDFRLYVGGNLVL